MVNNTPQFEEANKILASDIPDTYKRLVCGLLSKIEVLTRALQHANSRALKYYYSWPSAHISERPRHLPFESETPISDADVDMIIKEYFYRRKHENSA